MTIHSIHTGANEFVGVGVVVVVAGDDDDDNET